MNLTARAIVLGLVSCATFLPVRSDASVTVVVCAPGYPGTTEQAQPTMDDLARGIERAAAWPEGRIDAVYHPTMDGGLASLETPRAGIVLVPLPFYLEKRETLDLTPLVEVVHASGPDEVWSLVARKGAVKAAEDLAGWDVAGVPGYSAAFVRGVALGGWGELPPEARTKYSPRVLSVLRKAAGGEPVAALLDRAQTDALASLPFGDQLEIVTRSRPMIGSLVCEVGGRLGDEVAQSLAAALVDLARDDGNAALFDTMRISGFRPLASREFLAELERVHAQARRGSR